MNDERTIAAVGDVSDIQTWSGTPFYFWKAAFNCGFVTEPWRLNLSRINWQRSVWNLGGVFRGGFGGFQYSKWFLDLAEKQIPFELMRSEVITFNQHFPRSATVSQSGGIINHYLDAPFVALATGRGLDLKLPRQVVTNACRLERANYAASRRVVTMARWAAEVIVQECAVPASKVHVILPGANVDLPADWSFPTPVGRAGKERDFVLGFVGKEWERKGLPLLIGVRDELVRRGWRVSVQVAGHAPESLRHRAGVQFAGFIDKQTNPAGFLNFLASCDVGCLFSQREAFGVSTLEFLRGGVPVAGFAYEGPADTLPPDAGFRFPKTASLAEISDRFESYLQDEAQQVAFRNNARRWSPLVTWERCLREFMELWTTGGVKDPVRPWHQLPKSSV